MDDKIYNILWIDDEHHKLGALIRSAKDFNIKLIPYKSLDGGIGELERNYPMYDGVLLDAKFFENEDDEAGTEDTYVSFRAKERIEQLPKKFDIFILTGQAEAFEDKTFNKVFNNVFRKGIDKDEDALFESIIKSADDQEDTQIRHKYQRVFNVCTADYIGGSSSPSILKAIKNSQKEDDVDSKDYFLTIRKVLELLFCKLNNIGLVPDEIFNNNGWFNPTGDFITGKPSMITINDGVIHPTISFILRQLKEITQDAEHNIASRLRLKTDDFISINKSPFLYRSTLNQLFDVLIWFKNFIDEHPDKTENQKLHTRIEQPAENPANTDWINGEVYELTSNGWGKFISECGKIERSIPDYIMKRKNVNLGDTVKITLKPENNQHIKELSKIFKQ